MSGRQPHDLVLDNTPSGARPPLDGFTEEILIHDQHLARLTTETSPTLREDFGVGAHHRRRAVDPLRRSP